MGEHILEHLQQSPKVNSTGLDELFSTNLASNSQCIGPDVKQIPEDKMERRLSISPDVQKPFVVPGEKSPSSDHGLEKSVSENTAPLLKSCVVLPKQFETGDENRGNSPKPGDLFASKPPTIACTGENSCVTPSPKPHKVPSIRVPRTTKSPYFGQEIVVTKTDTGRLGVLDPQEDPSAPPSLGKCKKDVKPKQSRAKSRKTEVEPNSFDSIPASQDQPRDNLENTLPTGVKSIDEPIVKTRTPRIKRAKTDLRSPFFKIEEGHEREISDSPEKKRRARAGTVSCVPFPRLDAPRFGLIQEKLAHDPYRMLIAITFLVKTKGKDSIPVFFRLIERYDTPEKLAAAENDEIIAMVHHLGLQVSRAKALKKIASFFVNDPPVRGRRYRVLNYPEKGQGCGKDIKKDEVLTDEDERFGAWEIGHFINGTYALDSYRIFCRDILRGEAQGWNGEGRDDEFEPEWKRTVPTDKELRAILMWAWLREGLHYDALTGETEPASTELIHAAREGRIAWDDNGAMRIIDPEEVAQGEVKLVEGGGNSEKLLRRFEGSVEPRG